jgi:phenylacetate-CoA ligase
MGDLKQRIYDATPAFVQNLLGSGYGYVLARRRYRGVFDCTGREYDERQWWPQEQLTRYQDERLRALVRYAVEHVPFYTSLFAELGLEANDIQTVADLKKLPPLEKAAVRTRSTEMVTRDPERGTLYRHATGGTTGTPIPVFETASVLQHHFAACDARVRRWAGIDRSERVASFFGRFLVPVGQDEPPFWRRNTAQNQWLFSTYHMSEKNLWHYVAELQRIRPASIAGYVSAMYILARYLRTNGLVGAVAPRAVFTTSETLFDWQRHEIEAGLGCRVYNGYGSGEYCVLISECDAGGLHISPDYGIVEMEAIPESPGLYELLCTGLFNHAMPFIRYRIGDAVKASGRACRCGRPLPLVETIEGRVGDLVVTPEGRYVTPASLSLAFKAAPNLGMAQVVQETADLLVVHIVPCPGFSAADEQYLLGEIRRRVGHRIGVEIRKVEELEKTRAGKFPLVRNRMQRDLGAGVPFDQPPQR